MKTRDDSRTTKPGLPAISYIVILSEVRRQPNEVEGPRVTRQCHRLRTFWLKEFALGRKRQRHESFGPTCDLSRVTRHLLLDFPPNLSPRILRIQGRQFS